MGNEISWLDGPILRPMFHFLTKTNLAAPLAGTALKVIELMGNGVLINGRYGLQRVKWSSFKKLVLVGQSHLDAAWRWRTKQGILKARATIKKALDHIDSVPEFTFSQPSPQYYQWMKDNFPDIYQRIKKAVADGRFIPIGGSWVESDCNVPSGESHVRQRLYGQRFYLKEFGFIADLEFIQDSFGFNKNLPQIFKKSGARLFGTGKLFWNKNEKLPMGMCLWESPDGTRLPAIHIHFGYFLPLNYGKNYPYIYLLGKEVKNEDKKNEEFIANYQTSMKAYQNWRSRELMLESVFGYGLGDGGHGPIEAEIWAVSFLRMIFRKTTKHHQKGDVYTMLKKYFERWVVWNDEFYLDLHQGTYTTLSRVKRGNRDCENQIEMLEKLNAILSLMGCEGYRDEYESIWKTILYHQFHDILPGSSIPEVYLDYDKDLAFIKNSIRDNMKILVDFLSQRVTCDSSLGTPYIVFNPLSWTRKEVLKINMGNNSKAIIRDHNGKTLPTYVIKTSNLANNENIKEEYLAITELDDLPSTGFDLIYLSMDNKNASNILESRPLNRVELSEESDTFILKNQWTTVIISKKTGWINQIHNNSLKIDILNNPSNKILIFEEISHTDAWDIDRDYLQHQVSYDETNVQVTIIEKTELESVIQIQRTIGESIFIQTVGLTNLSPQVNLEMNIDLKNPKWLVKLEFNTVLESNTNKISSEIAYSFIDRTIKPVNKLDAARFEHCCQKFVSLFDENKNIGCTISNNGKYGYNVVPSSNKGTIIRPTIVRSPVYTGYAQETMFVNRPKGQKGLDPNMPKYTDLEFHRDIKFVLNIHKGDWRNDGWKDAYELNYPSVLIPITPMKNNSKEGLKVPSSPLSVEPSSVQLTAFKICEDDPNPKQPTQYILRLVEKIGKETSVSIKCDGLVAHQFDSMNIEITDLLEIPIADVEKHQNITKIKVFEKDEQKNRLLHNEKENRQFIREGSTFKVDIHPYEILTIKVTLG